MNESALTKQVREYLKSIPGLWHFKVHGGMYGTAGIPDIIGCFLGRFIALELKANGRLPTKLQDKTIQEIRKCGGIAHVVYTLREVQEILTMVKGGEV